MYSKYFKVAGVTFGERQQHLARVSVGDPARIVPEPENPYDPNALAVHIAVKRIPYILHGVEKIFEATGLAPMIGGKESHEQAPMLGGREVLHCGYVPRDLAAEIAPMLDGEAVDVRVHEVTGGFEQRNGSLAHRGLVMHIRLENGED